MIWSSRLTSTQQRCDAENKMGEYIINLDLFFLSPSLGPCSLSIIVYHFLPRSLRTLCAIVMDTIASSLEMNCIAPRRPAAFSSHDVWHMCEALHTALGRMHYHYYGSTISLVDIWWWQSISSLFLYMRSFSMPDIFVFAHNVSGAVINGCYLCLIVNADCCLPKTCVCEK